MTQESKEQPTFYGLCGVTISDGSRKAARGPEFLLTKYQGNWPLSDHGDIIDEPWIRNHPGFAEKFGVALSVSVGQASGVVRVCG